MGRIGDDDFLALEIATRTVIVVNDHQTCQLTMSTSVGLKGEMSQTGQCTQRAFQQRHQGASTLNRMVGLQGMKVLELRQGSHLLVDFGVILHRTGPQGIEARIDTEVIIREIRIVTHHCQLVAFGEISLRLTTKEWWQLVIAIIVLRQAVAFSTLF